MPEVVVSGRWARAGDGVEVGALGGGGAGVRILEGDGLVAAEAEVVECELVEIGLGLGRGDVLSAGEELETIEQPEAGKVALAVGVHGIRGEGDGQAVVAGGVEERDDAGSDCELEIAQVIAFAAVGFQGSAIGTFFKSVPRIEGVIGVADGAEKVGLVEGDAVGGVDVGVGGDEGGLGVEDQPVEIKDEGADHGLAAAGPEDGKAWRVTKDKRSARPTKVSRPP